MLIMFVVMLAANHPTLIDRKEHARNCIVMQIAERTSRLSAFFFFTLFLECFSLFFRCPRRLNGWNDWYPGRFHVSVGLIQGHCGVEYLFLAFLVTFFRFLIYYFSRNT